MNATASLREQLQLQHDEGRIIYENTVTMDESLNNQVIDTAKDTYLKELENKYTGFLGFTCRDIIEHLIDQYGRITTAYLEYNNQQMNDLINSYFPIDKYFK